MKRAGTSRRICVPGMTNNYQIWATYGLYSIHGMFDNLSEMETAMSRLSLSGAI